MAGSKLGCGSGTLTTLILATGGSLLAEGVGAMRCSADEMVCSRVEDESVKEPLELCERVKEREERERRELVF